MEKNGQNLFAYQEKLRNMAEHVCLLDRKIPIEHQLEYFAVLQRLLKSDPMIKQLSEEECISMFDRVLDDTVGLSEKKEILVKLSMVHWIKVYRLLEEYDGKVAPELDEWLYLSLLISRLSIEMDLSGERQVFVSTGLGGKGEKMRFNVVFISKGGYLLEDFQKNLIKQEFMYSFPREGYEIEKMDIEDRYVNILFLMPIKTNLENLFQTVLNECNQYGDFLSKTFILSNEREFTEKDIEDAVRKECGS